MCRNNNVSKSAKILSTEFQKQLEDYCRSNPRYSGLFISAARIATSREAQLERILSLLKGEIQARTRGTGELPDLRSALVLVDASPTSRLHTSIWLPTICDLKQREVELTLASKGEFVSIDKAIREDMCEIQDFNLVNIRYQRKGCPDRFMLSLKNHLSALPWKGLFGLTLGLWQIKIDGLISTWKSVLSRSSLKLVMTTNPITPQAGALLYASKDRGIETMQLTQGLPLITWQFPSADIAVVWSELGKKLLIESGWNGSHMIAKHPGIPSRSRLQELRIERRRQLGIHDDEFCILYLGQKSVDKVFAVDAYRETCEMIGKAVKIALRSLEFVFCLRPHPDEPVPETEQILQKYDIDRLLVSKEESLVMDVASADVVLSMQSGALEEAYLMGKPIIQAIAPGFAPVIDFRSIGAHQVSSADELAKILEKRAYISYSSPPTCSSLSEVISNKVTS